MKFDNYILCIKILVYLKIAIIINFWSINAKKDGEKKLSQDF